MQSIPLLQKYNRRSKWEKCGFAMSLTGSLVNLCGLLFVILLTDPAEASS